MRQLDISTNLRRLCGFERSVSEACRAMGINRQQFNKYVNGSSRPSPYNLQRICDHFGVRPADMFLPSGEFAALLEQRGMGGPGAAAGHPEPALQAAFPGDRRALRRYLGYYLTHCHSFSWDGYVLRAVARLYEQDGLIVSKTVERTRDPDDGALFLSKYRGQASLLGNRIFVVEHQSLADDAIVETVLYPAARSQLTLLRGVTFGLSSKQRHPYVSRSVWKFLGTSIDLRSAIAAAGLVPRRPGAIDPKVMRALGSEPFPNDLLHHDFEPH